MQAVYIYQYCLRITGSITAIAVYHTLTDINISRACGYTTQTIFFHRNTRKILTFHIFYILYSVDFKEGV